MEMSLTRLTDVITTNNEMIAKYCKAVLVHHSALNE